MLKRPTSLFLFSAGNNKSKKNGPQMPPQNMVSPLQYSAMLKLYSTTTDDSVNFGEPQKSELATRKGSSSSGGGGGVGANGGPSAGHSHLLNKKSSFEGKEYSRLSTNEKDGTNRNGPETVFSSSAEDSDIPEPVDAKSKPDAPKSESSKKNPQESTISQHNV